MWFPSAAGPAGIRGARAGRVSSWYNREAKEEGMTLAFISRELNQFISLYLIHGGKREEIIKLLSSVITNLRKEESNA